MSIRLRTKKLIWAGVIGAAIMLIISAISGYIYYTNAQERELELQNMYQEKLKELQLTTEQNEVGYALTKDVKRGEAITGDMLVEVTLPILAKAENAMIRTQFETTSYFARTDLKAKTVLVDSFVYMDENIANDVREVEYSLIELPSKLKANDYVDVRIQFPNGDDYILFAKKKVKEVSGLTMWMDNDEGEILSMSSAIVDAYLEGAKIYAIQYVDGEMQISSQITYPVKDNVLSLIQSSPNIVNVAKLNLENQNRAALENGLSEMDEAQRESLREGEAETKRQVENQQAEEQSVKNKEEQEKIDQLNALNQFSSEETTGGSSE